MSVRQTRQREAIQRVMERARRPLSVQEILEGAQQQVATVNLATVYRNLKRMHEQGTVRQIELVGQPPRYEIAFATSSHQHHFHCEQCDRVFDVQGCPPGLSELVPENFRMTGHDIILYGTCERCEDTQPGQANDRPG